jgi:uncharacterized protein YkwD
MFLKCLVLVCVPLAIFGITFDDAARKALLDKHNEYRNDLAKYPDVEGKTLSDYGFARNMRKLKWDKTLADSAQEVANLCDQDHTWPDTPAIWSVRSRYNDFSIGQNLAHIYESDDILEATRGWFDLEIVRYRLADHSCQFTDPEKKCGHFTQMMWQNTEFLGCGYNMCNDYDGIQGTKWANVVCHYMQAGNLVTQDPFTIADEPRCPKDYDFDAEYPNLCERTSCSYDDAPGVCEDKAPDHQECFKHMMGSDQRCDHSKWEAADMDWMMDNCKLSCGYCLSPVDPISVTNLSTC